MSESRHIGNKKRKPQFKVQVVDEIKSTTQMSQCEGEGKGRDKDNSV